MVFPPSCLYSVVTPECKRLVSTGLWKSGYYAGWMYQSQMGGVTSRELLLAFGWLLAAGTLEKLLTRRVQQLDKTLVPPILVSPTGTVTHNT